MRTHVFVHSNQFDVFRNAICAVCDNVRKHKIHAVPETSADAREIDDRKLGESTSETHENAATQGV